jgi:hypothetical protein
VLDRCRGPVEVALKKAGLAKNEIDTAILIGGPMHMPVVREYLQNLLTQMGTNIVNVDVYKAFRRITEEGFRVDPMQCVAIGAAIASGSSIPIEPTPYGYGSDAIKKQEVQSDGSAVVTRDFVPIIEADSWQTEGFRDYRYMVVDTKGIGQVEFKLIATYKVWDDARMQPKLAYRELGTYALNIPLATPSLRFTLRRDQDSRRVAQALAPRARTLLFSLISA